MEFRSRFFVAGDDEEAKKKVAELVKATGFEPIESGPLSNSRYLEPVGEITFTMVSFSDGAHR